MSQKISSIVIEWVLALMFVVRRLLGPLGMCKFTVRCTEFVAWQFRNVPFRLACTQSIKRLWSCSFC